MTYESYKGCAFAWDASHGRQKGYLTCIGGYCRKDLIMNVERELGKPWRQIYREGGRAVKVKITEVPHDQRS